MSSHFGSYDHHANTIRCPRCGQRGAMLWEDVPPIEGGKELVRIEGDFHERLASKTPYPIELICDHCGTVQAAA